MFRHITLIIIQGLGIFALIIEIPAPEDYVLARCEVQSRAMLFLFGGWGGGAGGNDTTWNNSRRKTEQ